MKFTLHIFALVLFSTILVEIGQADTGVTESNCTASKELTITPGVGVIDLIEVNKTPDEIEAKIGKGERKRESRNTDCLKFKGREQWQYFIDYPEIGVKAYINYNRRVKDELVDLIVFNSTFVGELDNRIRIGQTTREMIYITYGEKKYHNPAIEYDSLGLGFLFDNPSVKGKPEDMLVEISVFPPKRKQE